MPLIAAHFKNPNMLYSTRNAPIQNRRFVFKCARWSKMFDVTSDFVYVRLHSDVKIYTSGYSDRALEGWARRVRRWARDERDVYVYFDNDRVHPD